jgi:hypothetical protein
LSDLASSIEAIFFAATARIDQQKVGNSSSQLRLQTAFRRNCGQILAEVAFSRA